MPGPWCCHLIRMDMHVRAHAHTHKHMCIKCRRGTTLDIWMPVLACLCELLIDVASCWCRHVLAEINQWLDKTPIVNKKISLLVSTYEKQISNIRYIYIWLPSVRNIVNLSNNVIPLGPDAVLIVELYVQSEFVRTTYIS